MTQGKQVRIPFLLVGYKTMDEVGRRFNFIGKALSAMRPNLSKELAGLGIALRPEYYMVGALLSALIYVLLAFAFVFALLLTSPAFTMEARLRVAALVGLLILVLFYALHAFYPSILIKKISARSEKDLLFSLREIMVSVNSGVPLFDAIKNVSSGSYGQVSEDFASVVKQVEMGIPEKEALKLLAIRSESEHMKRAIWQLINSLESGGSLSTSLPGIVDELEHSLYRSIRSYSASLNFLMLVYLLVAAAIPSLGITFLVLLSAFSGIGITVSKIMLLLLFAAVGQITLIGYMSSTRPDIFGG
jgi:flagellar protein FlaJ